MTTKNEFILTYSKLAEKIRIILAKEDARKKERHNRGEDFNIFKVMRLQNDEALYNGKLKSKIDSCIMELVEKVEEFNK